MSQAGELNSANNIVPGDVATTYVTNSGSAVPAGNILNVVGSNGITTAGSGNTVTISGSGEIAVINGDTGSITGHTVTIFAGQATQNCGSTVSFNNSGTISTLNVSDIPNANMFFGSGAGNSTMSGNSNMCFGIAAGQSYTNDSFNTAFGYLAHAGQIGCSNNTCFGYGSQELMTTNSNRNTAMGYNAAHDMDSASNNCSFGYGVHEEIDGMNESNAFGSNSQASIGTANYNDSFGFSSLKNLQTGSNNCAFGHNTGSSYTGAETNNICIGYNVTGTLAESNVIRLGNASHTKAFITGIDGVNVGSVAKVVTEASNQLGTATITSGTGVSIVATANTITVNAVGLGLTWSDTSGTVTASSNNGYFISNTCTSTLPAAPNEGDVVSYILDASVTLTVTGNTGQKIRVASAISASAGTSVATVQGNTLTLVYRTSGTTWIAQSVIGTWVTT